ncbi:MAG: hypothetical protein QNJ44_19205 [Rhodobacter sp.]|nr:hypothetical protein [Rhodobacter sp.]
MAGLVPFALALGLSTDPAAALIERVDCTVSAPCPGRSVCVSPPVDVSFTIDSDQFALAYSPDEPPRKKITTVKVAGERFNAEPILMAGGVRGFWAESFEGTHLLTFAPGKDAVYSRPIGQRLTGRCEVHR